MPNDDLLAHASSPIDFYALLGVAFETSESDIRRAYRKTALKYHPDKLGAAFDPDKFHLLQIANDVLSDPAAKAAYDAVRSARRQKERQHELFEGKRRQMKEELEAREHGGVAGIGSVRVDGLAGKRARQEDEEGEMEREVRRLAEEGKRRRMELERRIRAQGGDGISTTTPTATAMPPTMPQATGRPATTTPVPDVADASTTQTAAEEAAEEDAVARLERRIQQAQEAKARRKADKKAKRKSEAFLTSETSSKTPFETSRRWGDGQDREREDAATTTPSRRADLQSGPRAKERPPASAPPKFSFAPSTSTMKTSAFADTMERLKMAEKQRLEAEIRKQDAAAAAATTAP